MDKSKICVSRTINLAKKNPCKRKTNLLVYEKSKKVETPCHSNPQPPICAVPLKRIRIATGDELKRMCAPRPCPPTPESNLTLIGAILRMLGLGMKMMVAGGLVYWTYEAGFWSDGETSDELYRSLCEVFKNKSDVEQEELNDECNALEDLMCAAPPGPQHCKKSPISVEKSSYYLRLKWNKLITTLFTFITTFPDCLIEPYREFLKRFEKNKKCT